MVENNYSIQLVCPHLTYKWCTEDMVASFGDSDIPVLIVDNSDDNELKDCQFPPNVEVVHFGRNVGVSAAWNVGIKKGADQTVIISQWVRFAPAELPWRKEYGLNHVADGIRKYANNFGLEFADQGYHIMSVGRATIEDVGLFDENFLVFGGDDDYQHRRHLSPTDNMTNCWGDYQESGVHSIAFGIHKRRGGLESIVGGYDTSNYYSSKWCSVPYDYPGDFQYPFNKSENSLKYWPSTERTLGGWDN